MTYMLDGKQYVSVLAGRSGHGRIYTFALGANLAIPTAASVASTATTTAIKTTQSGVFSDAQAARGKAQYSQKCAACHMADLSGNGSATPLAGGSFTQSWNGHTMDELFNVISTTMPQGNAGGLSPDAYADIIAYMLKVNGLPSGSDELQSHREILRFLTINFENH